MKWARVSLRLHSWNLFYFCVGLITHTHTTPNTMCLRRSRSFQWRTHHLCVGDVCMRMGRRDDNLMSVCYTLPHRSSSEKTDGYGYVCNIISYNVPMCNVTVAHVKMDTCNVCQQLIYIWSKLKVMASGTMWNMALEMLSRRRRMVNVGVLTHHIAAVDFGNEKRKYYENCNVPKGKIFFCFVMQRTMILYVIELHFAIENVLYYFSISVALLHCVLRLFCCFLTERSILFSS